MLCTSIIAIQYQLYLLKVKTQVSIRTNALFRFKTRFISVSPFAPRTLGWISLAIKILASYWFLFFPPYSSWMDYFCSHCRYFIYLPLDECQGISVIERRQFSLLRFLCNYVDLLFYFLYLPYILIIQLCTNAFLIYLNIFILQIYAISAQVFILLWIIS